MDTNIDKFYAYLKELDQNYTRLVDLLRQKLTAVEKNDLPRLDAIIKDEQAFVLLSRGFEGNIKTHKERLGIQGDTLGDVIEHLPEERRGEFRTQHRHLRSVLEEVQVLNTKCQSMIQDRLYTLDKKIKELDKSGAAPYKKEGPAGKSPTNNGTAGNGRAPGSGLFTKSV